MTGTHKLQWIPKRFGAGDTAGQGLQRSLGQPNFKPLDVLIRETVQNSWDARLRTSCPPEFDMRLRTLGLGEIDYLRETVFPEASEDLGLLQVLTCDDIQVIEISDRGTKGLGGPTRNDLAFHQGNPRDYVDYVLTIGAPPDAPGAGTYGFGKTAAYSASKCSTILIWSRWKNPSTEVYEERFVASAMGNSFQIDGENYTGRQWWGVATGDSSLGHLFEPATGKLANQLGAALFERGFEEGETGTSILVLDPKEEMLVDDELRLSGVDVWRQAFLDHLWPKLSECQDLERRMSIRIFDHGIQKQIVDTEKQETVLQSARECLTAIRETQMGKENESPFVSVLEIRSQRPIQLLGHLAVTHTRNIRDDDPLRKMLGTVTYMRNAAELVVTTTQFGDESSSGKSWVGVFKPLEELDVLFAQSEPPAHDAWNFESMLDSYAKGVVRRTLNKIKEVVAGYLRAENPVVTPHEAQSTATLSAALAGLVGVVDGSVPTGGREITLPKTGRYAKRAKAPKITIGEEPERSISSVGSHVRQITTLPLNIEAHGPIRFSVSKLGIATEGSSVSDAQEVQVMGWLVDGVLEASSMDKVSNEAVLALVVSHPVGTAIDVGFNVVSAE